MIVDTLLDHSSRLRQNEAFFDALQSIGAMDIRSIQDEGWLDEPDETDLGPDDDEADAEEWMDDDLDDAA